MFPRRCFSSHHQLSLPYTPVRYTCTLTQTRLPPKTHTCRPNKAPIFWVQRIQVPVQEWCCSQPCPAGGSLGHKNLPAGPTHWVSTKSAWSGQRSTQKAGPQNKCCKDHWWVCDSQKGCLKRRRGAMVMPLPVQTPDPSRNLGSTCHKPNPMHTAPAPLAGSKRRSGEVPGCCRKEVYAPGHPGVPRTAGCHPGAPSCSRKRFEPAARC